MKMLMVNHAPLTEPLEGGKQRVYYFKKGWAEGGISIDLLTVYDARGNYSRDDYFNIPVHGIEFLRPDYCGDFDDYLIGIVASRSPEIVGRIREIVVSGGYNIVDLEHPWLWPVVRLVLEDIKYSGKIIYNSQNVEFEIKGQSAGKRQEDPFTRMLRDAQKSDETDLAGKADLVFACSLNDKTTFEQFSQNVVKAPNGVRKRDLARRPLLSLKPRKPYAIFVGSNWPPNVDGFLKFAPALSERLKTGKVTVIGGCCGPIKVELSKILSRQSLKRFNFAGRVSEAKLARLIAGAKAYLIPIVSGGGSSIKTAEALGSGLPIVGTEFSLRGFEEYRDWPNLKICTEPESFAHAAVSLIEDDRAKNAEGSNSSEFHWESRVRATLDEIRRLM